MIADLTAQSVAFDSASAALLRGLAVAPVAVGELIASAQRVLGYFQQSTNLGDAWKLHTEENSKALIGAARTLNSTALSLQRLGTAPSEDIRALFILSGCAYAMYGNFPSASALLNENHIGSISDLNDGEAISVAVCNPGLASVIYAHSGLANSTRDFIEGLIAYITGAVEPEAPLVAQLERLMVESPSASICAAHASP